MYILVLVHDHSRKCEFAMSTFRDLGTIVKIANISTSWTLGGLQQYSTEVCEFVDGLLLTLA